MNTFLILHKQQNLITATPCQRVANLKYKNCDESQSDEVNGVGSIPVRSGGVDFEEIGQKQNRSF